MCQLTLFPCFAWEVAAARLAVGRPSTISSRKALESFSTGTVTLLINDPAELCHSAQAWFKAYCNTKGLMTIDLVEQYVSDVTKALGLEGGLPAREVLKSFPVTDRRALSFPEVPAAVRGMTSNQIGLQALGTLEKGECITC